MDGYFVEAVDSEHWAAAASLARFGIGKVVDSVETTILGESHRDLL